MMYMVAVGVIGGNISFPKKEEYLMPRSPGNKSDDLIRQEGRTAKAQGKRLSDNRYRGTRGFFETQKEYERRRMAKELWDEGYGAPE